MTVAIFSVGTDGGTSDIDANGPTGLNTGFTNYGTEINRLCGFLPVGTAVAAATSVGTPSALVLRDGGGGAAFSGDITAPQIVVTSTGALVVPLVLRGAPTDPAMAIIEIQNNAGSTTVFSVDNLGNSAQSGVAQAKQFYTSMVGTGPGIKVVHSGDGSNPPFLRFFASDGVTQRFQVGYLGDMLGNTSTMTWTNTTNVGLTLNAPNGQSNSILAGTVNSVLVFNVAADGSLAGGPLAATWTDITKVGVTLNAPNGQTGLLFNGKVNGASVFSVSAAGVVTGLSFIGSGAGLTGLTGSQFASGTIVFSKMSDGAVSADGVSTTLTINAMKFFDAAGTPVNYTGGTYTIPSGQIGTLVNQNAWILVYMTAAGTINSVASTFALSPTRPNKVQGTTPLMYVFSRSGMTAITTLDDSNSAHGFLESGWRNPWDFGAPSGFLTLTQVATGQTSLSVTGMAGSTVDLATFSAAAITNGMVQHIDKAGHFYGSQAALPTVAVGAGAGTGGSVGATVTGTDQTGVITLVTGSVAGTTNSVAVTLTYANAYTVAPRAIIRPANAAAATLSAVIQPYTDAAGYLTTSFTINTNSGALATGSTYQFVYFVE